MRKIFLIWMLMLALTISSVYAAASLSLLTTNWKQNSMINLSTKTANDNSEVNISNILIQFSSTATSNSTTVSLINITNTSATNFSKGYANFTFDDSFVLEDTSVGVVTAKTTGTGDSDAVLLAATTVIIDRTKPQSPTSLTTAKRVSGDTITATVNNFNTTACTLSFGLGGIRKAMTYSASTCTYTVATNEPPDGIYQYIVYASDGLNETGSNVAQIEIDTLSNPVRRSPSSLQTSSFAQTVQSQQGGGGGNLFGIIAIVIIVYLVANAFNKK